MSTREKLVPVATTDLPHQIHLWQSVLLENGIESFVENEETVATDWLYSTAVGGIRLLVQKVDEKAAGRILRKLQKKIDEPWDYSRGKEPVDPNYDGPICPRCNSDNVFFRRAAVIPTLVTLITLGYGRRWRNVRWICANCDGSWLSDRSGHSFGDQRDRFRRPRLRDGQPVLAAVLVILIGIVFLMKLWNSLFG